MRLIITTSYQLPDSQLAAGVVGQRSGCLGGQEALAPVQLLGRQHLKTL